MSDPLDIIRNVRVMWYKKTNDGHEYVIYENGTCRGFPEGNVTNVIHNIVSERIRQAIKFNALVVPFSFRLHRLFQRIKGKVFGTQPKQFPEIQTEVVP